MYQMYKVTYVDSNVTQFMYCIPQDIYDSHKFASTINADDQAWKGLTDDARADYLATIRKYAPEMALFKKGKAFTDKSLIGQALSAGDNLLRLPSHQGGTRKIIFALIDNLDKDCDL